MNRFAAFIPKPRPEDKNSTPLNIMGTIRDAFKNKEFKSLSEVYRSRGAKSTGAAIVTATLTGGERVHMLIGQASQTSPDAAFGKFLPADWNIGEINIMVTDEETGELVPSTRLGVFKPGLSESDYSDVLD